VVLALLLATPLHAQNGGGTAGTAGAVMTDAIRAYQDLDFDAAARLLRRVLTPPLAMELSDAERARALSYLGAAEHYRGRPDSAIAVFRRLAVLAPRDQPDTLIFPPEVTRLYNAVRGSKPDTVNPSTPRVAIGTAPPAPPPPPPPPPPPSPLAPPVSTGRVLPAPEPTAARGEIPGQMRITATAAGLVSRISTSSDAGTTAGFAGSVRFRRVELAVRYAEGTLQPADGNSASRDLVEGAVALRFVGTPWLSVELGPQARRYDTPSGAERWMTWRLGGRVETAIVGTSVRGHATLWNGLGLEVNVPPGAGSARGGALGVTVDLGPGRPPLWFSLEYGIDRAQVRNAGRRETVEALTLTAGLRRR